MGIKFSQYHLDQYKHSVDHQFSDEVERMIEAQLVEHKANYDFMMDLMMHEQGWSEEEFKQRYINAMELYMTRRWTEERGWRAVDRQADTDEKLATCIAEARFYRTLCEGGTPK